MAPDIVDVQMKLSMSATLAQITCMLIDNKLVTHGDLAGMDISGRVAMHRVRKALDLVGVELRSRRHLGYWLDDDDKTKLVEFCTPSHATDGGGSDGNGN